MNYKPRRLCDTSSSIVKSTHGRNHAMKYGSSVTESICASSKLAEVSGGLGNNVIIQLHHDPSRLVRSNGNVKLDKSFVNPSTKSRQTLWITHVYIFTSEASLSWTRPHSFCNIKIAYFAVAAVLWRRRNIIDMVGDSKEFVWSKGQSSSKYLDH